MDDELEFQKGVEPSKVEPNQNGAQKQHKIMALAGDMTEYYAGFDLAAERASWDRVFE